ncbi:MAG: 30S ribosomal protein S20 [Deltaproteobacteria bacterium]|nr:30S ribosomal protein S20 [Deltaproteobacteria bacterium]MBW2360388.1 30S ribosomal protein S20 [Deltaproteobacteria bacterium]
MATHKSATKRARQDLVRRARNRDQRSRVRGAIRQARAAIALGDAGEANSAVRRAESLLRRATSKGVLHSKTASRQISRLAKAVQAL